MSDFFEAGKWYVLSPTKREEFIKEAPSINKEIAKFLDGNPFEVSIRGDGDVVLIRLEGGKWLERIDAIPQCSIDDYGAYWFYAEDYNEHHCFDEVEAPSEEEKYIIVFTENIDSSYDTEPRRVVGGSTPTMFTEKNAKETAKKLLEESEDPKAKVEIFCLSTTAQVVKEIKFI